MKKEIILILGPKKASSEKQIKFEVAKKLQIKPTSISAIKVLRRSIDARKSDVKINLKIFVVFSEPAPKFESPKFFYQDVRNAPPVIIVGAGPAGLFAALRLIELGRKPILLERGKEVSKRKIDIATLARDHIVNPESNYCFGEGGAGTFSDGKLYTRSKKRGENRHILEVLQFHGAQEEILTDAHPHIGTNVLPSVIVNIRNSILNAGGEIHFNTRVEDLIIKNNSIAGVETASDDKITAKAVILATGHSARDVYHLLHEHEILIEPKAFAMGVRIEHPQALIDSIQYHCDVRSKYLPAAAYNLATQIDGRGVYSFCMCPGGYIVPSATGTKEIVVNGMSPSKRNSPFANSGMVVEITQNDLKEFSNYGALAGLHFQQHIEQLAYENASCDQTAPAQRMVDFVEKRFSRTIPETSYYCGTVSSPLHDWLPESIAHRLQKAFVQFGKKSKGFFTNEAAILGVESRTSSPVRIPRNPDTLEHPQIKGIYPAGEGSGYAGGIVSSAIDGQRCAEKAAKKG